MDTFRLTASVLVSCCAVTAVAQTARNTGTTTMYDEDARLSFAFVVASSAVAVEGDWHAVDTLRRYAHDHPGTYIVFMQEGEFHRLNAPERLTEAQQMYAPMYALAAKQRALAAEQKPLAEQQRALAAEQRAAVSPAEQSRIGALQGELGQQQGALGARQGEIGRKQGELGRVFYRRVQSMLDACLADGSCPRVATEQTTVAGEPRSSP